MFLKNNKNIKKNDNIPNDDVVDYIPDSPTGVTEREIDQLLNKKFTSPKDKIDHSQSVKELYEGRRFKSAEAQRVFDNVQFADEVSSNPISTRKFDKEVMGYETITFNHYLNQRIWPRSIYTTDKLVRLAMSAKLEFLKRYLSKKRSVPMNMIWLLLILFGVAAAIIVILLIILPLMGG